MLNPSTIDDLRETILKYPRLHPCGSGSKTGLSTNGETPALAMSAFKGLREYEPSEYTITALAGTRTSEIETILEANGQFLPFDPPFVGKGSTLGGVLASGLSGSGRYRYGGVRDFILSIEFVDGNGRLIKSGGKVVKNAAGFDLSKLMVGSLGSFGALIELTFKVFPRPAAYRTIMANLRGIKGAIDIVKRLVVSPLELYCLDIHVENEEVQLILRIGGPQESLGERIERLKGLTQESFKILDGDREQEYWRNVRDFCWLPEKCSLIKVPITPKSALQLDKFLMSTNVIRRYTVGANLAWIGWAGTSQELDLTLQEMNLSGLVVIGSAGHARIGSLTGLSFYRRVKKALDPADRWAEI